MRIRQYWLIIFLALGTAVFIFTNSNKIPSPIILLRILMEMTISNIYNYFTGTEENYVVEFPFHQRILVPFLAAQINSGDIISDFQWVNLFFTMLVIVVLFYLWRILGFDLKWIWFGFIWLLFHWSGLIRLNAFDPVTVDLPLYTFQGILLIFLFKRKFVHLLWLAPLATIQKESFIGLMVILCLYAWWHNKKTKEEYFEMSFILAATILAISAQSVVNYNFSPAQESKGKLS